jgi:hypothetical protein
VNGLVTHKNILYSGGSDNRIVAWDLLKSFEKIGEIVITQGYINCMTLDPQKGIIYAAGENKLIVGVGLFAEK